MWSIGELIADILPALLPDSVLASRWIRRALGLLLLAGGGALLASALLGGSPLAALGGAAAGTALWALPLLLISRGTAVPERAAADPEERGGDPRGRRAD